MKFKTVISFLFFFSTIYAQNVKIYGNVFDASTPYSSVILSPSVPSKLVDAKIETNPKKGYFEFNILISTPSFYRLFYKEKRITLFIVPGANLQLNIDNSKEKDFINFYGDFVNENTLLNQESFPSMGTKAHRDDLKLAAVSGKKAYFDKIEELRKIQEDQFNQLTDNAQLSNQFLELYRSNYIEMSSLILKYYFPRFLGLNQDSFIATNPDLLDIYSSLPILYEYLSSALYVENLLNYTKGVVNKNHKQEILAKNVDDLSMYKEYILQAEKMYQGEVRNLIIENLIGEWIANFGRINDLKDEIIHYTDHLATEDRKSILKKRLINLAQYETGNPAPIFSFEDYAGNKRNLREFIGKIVYIHVWSSQDESSLKEVLAARNIYDRYKDSVDLVTLYLSIDANKEAWENTIRVNKMLYDIQAISFPNGFNSDFARKYAIQKLPTYILIDKSGNLIASKLPPPSQSEKLIPYLDKLFLR